MPSKEKARVMVIGMRTSLPKKKYEVKSPQREATNNGIKEESVRSSPKTSIANRIAAIGTLKIEAKAAAQAQASKSILLD